MYNMSNIVQILCNIKNIVRNYLLNIAHLAPREQSQDNHPDQRPASQLCQWVPSLSLSRIVPAAAELPRLARAAAAGPAITAAASGCQRPRCSSLVVSVVECTYSTLYWHVWTTNFNFCPSKVRCSESEGQCKLMFLSWQVVRILLPTSSGWSDSVATFKVALEIRLSFSSTALSSRVSVKKQESAWWREQIHLCPVPFIQDTQEWSQRCNQLRGCPSCHCLRPFSPTRPRWAFPIRVARASNGSILPSCWAWHPIIVSASNWGIPH